MRSIRSSARACLLALVLCALHAWSFRVPGPRSPRLASSQLQRVQAARGGPRCAPRLAFEPPSRDAILGRMQDEEFDILVIGGGATGLGVALDASLRGLKVALVERSDFSSGTSSRSTKLIHGGLRYLAQAFQKKLPPRSIPDVIRNLRFEPAYLRIVAADLKERAFVLASAPFMAEPIPMMVPLYAGWWEVPMMLAVGIMYDLIAGTRRAVPGSRLVSPEDARAAFPALAEADSEGRKLLGCLLIHDGQQNDARMGLHIGLSAIKEGAACTNYAEVKQLSRDPATGRLSGALVRDRITGREINVRAAQVVNACGVFADGVRRMAEPGCAEIMVPSYGAHVALERFEAPGRMGLVWFTNDGRVLYLLPWEGSTIAGTTDTEGPISFEPKPTPKDVDFILSECNRVVDRRLDAASVRSAWAGIRPLVRNPEAAAAGAEGTAALSRDHVVDVLEGSGLVSIVGGKWTTYRKMAEDAVDACLARAEPAVRARAGPCRTLDNRLVGTGDGSPETYRAQEAALRRDHGLSEAAAAHLTRTYGTRAMDVVAIAAGEPALLEPVHPAFVQIMAEIVHACRNEYALSAVDMIAHRTRFSFLDAMAAAEALPAVLELMARELGWAREKVDEQEQAARTFLATMDPKPTADEPKPAAMAQA
mmetsp:Transcript_5064/g.17019  ORF Transcript_5064/g.17019 Transcript_5064/m.17019 type:complete len:651 (+) Transcript_5064:26-1978(+)